MINLTCSLPLPPQCHLGGVVLHFCHSLGQRALHSLWHPAVRLRHPPLRGCLHLCGSYLLPAVRRGLPLVVEERAEHGLHRPLYLCLLCFLLPKSVVDERPGPKYRVLWLLSADGARLLADAGQRVFLVVAGVYSIHLPKPQNGLTWHWMWTTTQLCTLLTHIFVLSCSFDHTETEACYRVNGLFYFDY